jgi:hypothetical protein
MKGRWWIACVMALTCPVAAHGQAPSPSENSEARWVGHATVLAGNTVLGALTGGLLRLLHGGSATDGVLRGALGGAVGYAGKRIVVQRFSGAGLLGREVNAVGVSIVRNAGDGTPTFARLFLPLGPLPLRATVTLAGGLHVAPRLDPTAAAWLAAGLFAPDVHLDLAESFSSGAPVFAASARWLDEADPGLRGYAISRSVFLGDPTMYPGLSVSQGDVLAHERVHILQEDFVLTAWSEPLASAAFDRLAVGRWLERYTATDILGWMPGLMSRFAFGADGVDHSPGELEARFLAR